MNTGHAFSLWFGLFSLLLSSCSGVSNSVSRVNEETPPEALKQPWRHMMKCCHVDPNAVTVVCPAEDFRTAMKSCVSIWEQKGLCESRLTEAIKLGLVDKAELEARAYDLQAKLDSPWRQWYLWLLVGAAAGTAVGVGVSLGTK